MGKSLYEMTREFEELKSLLEDGEIDADAAKDTVEAMELTIKQKTESVSAFIMNQSSEIEQLKEAEKRIASRRKALEKAKAKMHEYLLAGMVDNGIHEISCPAWKVKLANCPVSVDIMADAEVPKQYLREKVTVSPDKKALKKALQEGHEIEGVSLVNKKTLRFS